MADLPEDNREKMLEQTEQLYIMGLRTPTEISRNLGIRWETAKRYLDIVRRRIRNRYKNSRLYTKQLTRELSSLDLMERRSWADYLKIKVVREQNGVDEKGKAVWAERTVEQDEDTKVRIMANILKFQERRAALLGLDAPKSNMVMQLNQNLQETKLGRRLTDDELKELTSVFTRITDELASHTQRKVTATAVDSEKESPALRADVPPALPNQPSTQVPPGHGAPPSGGEAGRGSSPA